MGTQDRSLSKAKIEVSNLTPEQKELITKEMRWVETTLEHFDSILDGKLSFKDFTQMQQQQFEEYKAILGDGTPRGRAKFVVLRGLRSTLEAILGGGQAQIK